MARYDYRGAYLPELIPQHPLGIQQADVMHACPECPIGSPHPFCPVCLGAGLLTADRLDRWADDVARHGMLAGSGTW